MKHQPHIIVSSSDMERLTGLLHTQPMSASEEIEALLEELDRAEVRNPEDMPPDVITMNSTVRFAIDSLGKEFCLTLVYPNDANGSAGRVSIFAPVGSALLGLSAGDRIEWPRPGGGVLDINIIEVVSLPEREVDFIR